jgi:tricorn protease
VRTRTELSDLIWEMQGELGTSHAYEYGGDHRTPPQYQRGFLGADFRWNDASSGYEIAAIYRGDSWNRSADSPLAEPGHNIRIGDVLVAIGGKRLSREITPDRLLVNTAGRDISLTIRSGKDDERVVVVKTLANESALRYRAWVDRNREYVHAKTNGRVGYVHIPDMGPWGFAEFHRGFLSEFDRRGLIVDVRYNRGGHVSPLLLEKLARKRVGYDVPRYGQALPYPPESVNGPMVALTNQFAGSDGDIFSHCFKLYKLGPLVGKRTWGGVIGISPYHHLVDGTMTTQPEYSFWFVDVGWKVENYGTDPDYDVDIAPHDYRADTDPQMDFALRLIERSVETHVGVRPDQNARPSLPLPTLQ